MLLLSNGLKWKNSEDFYSRLIKSLLLVFNIICFFGGLMIAIAAGYIAFDKNAIHKILTQLHMLYLLNGFYGLFAASLLLTATVCFGFWGSITEKRCLLIMSMILIVIASIFLLGSAIVLLINYLSLKNVLQSTLRRKPFVENTLKGLVLSSAIYVGVSDFQKQHHCCGIDGPQDYGANPIPSTCYTSVYSQRYVTKRSGFTALNKDDVLRTSTGHVLEHVTMSKQETVYQSGCATFVSKYLYVGGGVIFVVVLLNLTIIGLTVCFLSVIRRGYQPIQKS